MNEEKQKKTELAVNKLLGYDIKELHKKYKGGMCWGCSSFEKCVGSSFPNAPGLADEIKKYDEQINKG